VQTQAPRFTERRDRLPDGRVAAYWVAGLSVLPGLIALGLLWQGANAWILLGGLLLFGVVFAVNSSLHSYLIVAGARRDGVSLDVGFYYMSNALGRLLGTLLSGCVYQSAGLVACLWWSCALLITATLISLALPRAAPIR